MARTLRSLTSWLLVLVASTVTAAASASAAPPRPNFIIIFTDDLGYHDLGCYGATTIKTPHLDRLAAEGLRLTSFYAQPVCGVSRAALMTGCYPIRVGEPGNLKRLHTVLHPQEVTMAEVLKSAGYATAIIGKWHLGDASVRTPTGQNPETMPNAQGFDYFYGTPLFNGTTVRVQDNPFRSAIVRDRTVVVDKVETWDQITGDYTREAIQWIQGHKDQPFFLYLAHNMPHIPLGASASFAGRSAYGPYGDAVEEIDWSCGEILKTLKQLELDERTVVVFTSDNGPWIETTAGMKPGGRPLIPRNHSGSADPLRGWKMSAWDGGSRVPALVRWPGKTPAGKVSDELTTTMDLLPTFAALAGAKLPAERTLDGVDLSQFLQGQTETSPREHYFYYTACRLTAVRSGHWKLVLPRPANPPDAGWWGRMIEAIPENQLFDLQVDPAESRNVAADHPDVVARLLKQADYARRELGDSDRTGSGARFFDAGPRRLEATSGPGGKGKPK